MCLYANDAAIIHLISTASSLIQFIYLFGFSKIIVGLLFIYSNPFTYSLHSVDQLFVEPDYLKIKYFVNICISI